MSDDAAWKAELKVVVDLMREISRQSDPQVAARIYGKGLRDGKLVPAGQWVSVSIRDMVAPAYCITRSSRWKEEINPWTQKEKLPTFSAGLLGELIYSNEPTLIEDLPACLSKDDPAYEYLAGCQMLVSLPTFDEGVALNMTVLLISDPANFPRERIPILVWQSNLWGRSVLNLVLRKQLKTAYDALESEMAQVGLMQRQLLPAELPQIDGLEMAAHYRTSQRAGGDYYDVFDCGDGRWGLLIADVSGHGTPAAVIMAITHAIAHLHPGQGTPPGELLGFINRSLVRRYTGDGGSFVTAFYGIFDPAKRTLIYARAGHNPPRLLRNGRVTELDRVGGLPLGLFDPEAFEEEKVELSAGDLLLFYTDGITEARSPDREMFGTQRLDEALAGDGPAAALIRRVIDAVGAFAGGTPPDDDQTLVAVKVG